MPKAISLALEKLNDRVNKINSLLCVGLDSDFNRLPSQFLTKKHPQFEFNRWIIEQTHSYVCAYKPNPAFYEARGYQGWLELEMTMQYLQSYYPDIFLIVDAKRGDIGSTSEQYLMAVLDKLGADAITLSPYLGKIAIKPFLARKDKVIIVLARTSNPGAEEFQDLMANGKPIWQHVAKQVVTDWNSLGNCMLVAGATYPHELKIIRQIVGEMPLLVPGVGAQGGDLKVVLQVGLNSQNRGLVINSSRGIIFAKDPQNEAKKIQATMKTFLGTN